MGFLFFNLFLKFSYIKKKKNLKNPKQTWMKCTKKKCRKIPKQNILSQESRDEAQRPCQTSSFMISLLHPDLLRCSNGDGVHWMSRLKINSWIGKKTKSPYQLLNKCHRTLCFWPKHFLLSCLFARMQLETVWMSMPIKNSVCLLW